jgi:fatty acid-binding protein 3
MSGWNGKFELESSENFDDFLKALGVGFMLRNAAKLSTPTVEITNDGDSFTMKTVTTFKTTEIKFSLGQEFDETRMDGVTVKTTITKEGDNKLIQSQGGEPPCTITRELIEDGAKLKTVRDVTLCLSVFPVMFLYVMEFLSTNIARRFCSFERKNVLVCQV